MKLLARILFFVLLFFLAIVVWKIGFGFAARLANKTSFDLASQIPRYPNATYWDIHSSFATFCIGDFAELNCPHSQIDFDTNDQPEKIISFFEKELSGMGWKCNNLIPSSEILLYYKFADKNWYEFDFMPIRMARYWYGNYSFAESLSPKKYSIILYKEPDFSNEYLNKLKCNAPKK